MSEPLVTVLMPVYNGADYLKTAIESILNQSYKNIEFLIVNDGSTDSSAKIISEQKDSRIRLLNNDINKGLVYSLNLGLKEAKGEYIARMDADDVSLKDRLKKQIDVLKANPDIGICGTSIKVFGAGRREEIFNYPQTHEECMVRLLFNTCMAHPTVVFRKEVVEKYGIQYKAEFFPAEDFEVWAVNSDKVTYANIQEALYEYRVHPVQISLSKLEIQNKVKFSIQLLSLQSILPDLTEEETTVFEKISLNNYSYTIDFLERCEQFFIKMLEKNRKKKVFDQHCLEKEVGNYWFNICTDFSSNKVYTLKKFRQSILSRGFGFDEKHLRFYAKNFLILIKVIQ